MRAHSAASAGSEVPPVHDDQPTVISSRPPLATGSISDSACRILRGQILPGDRLGHFELVQYVGGGGMGRVFRAVDRGLARPVALKVLTPEQAADEETLLRFKKEAQSAARLDHQNIARVYHVAEDRGLHYIVFEFIEGINIRGLVQQKGPLPLAEAISYTLQIAEALAHADGRNVVHRDVKPSNVLITPEGRVKLIDMGLARLREVDASAADLTASGVTLGTFDYISPEQARDPRNADVRSDIYSLGCTFFYMLAGQPPFPEGTVLQKLLQHQGDQPPDVREFRPELPDEVARTLRKMLAKDPRHRYRDPAQLVEDLLALARQLGLRTVGPVGSVFVTHRARAVSLLRRHLPWIAPIAALVCIALLLDFVSKQGGEMPPSLSGPRQVARNNGQETPASDQGKHPSEGAARDQSVPPSQASDADTKPPDEPNGAAATNHHVPQPEPPPNEGPPDPTWLDLRDRLIAGRSNSSGLGFVPLAGSISAADGTSRLLSVVTDAEAVSGQLSGATGTATGPLSSGPAAEPVRRASLLVVNDLVRGENEFLTLSAACSAAGNNDVIELRYNGRRKERPIALANLKLRIQAGEGYQPVVVFQPGENEIDPVKYPRSMFALTAGRLTLINVALELHVPRGVPADNWSLFETQGGQTVRLEECALSIRNASDQLAAYHQEVAFFRAKSAPGADVMITDDSSAATPPMTIDLVDCVARGEAVFLCAADLQPLQLIWENGLLVTTERLLSEYGGQRIPQFDELLSIDLRHVTAVVRGGLCRMTNSQLAPHQLATQITCTNSILKAASGAPLIEQMDADASDDFQQEITFNGDGNFYEDFTVFWAVRDLSQDIPSEPMTFEQWKSHWGPEHENLPRLNQVVWKKLPEPDRPVHTHTPADYTLSDSTESQPNPPIGAAGGGRNAGFRADRLPGFPPEPSPEKPDNADVSS